MILLLQGSDQLSMPTSRRTPIIISTPAGCLAEPETPPTTRCRLYKCEHPWICGPDGYIDVRRYKNKFFFLITSQ